MKSPGPTTPDKPSRFRRLRPIVLRLAQYFNDKLIVHEIVHVEQYERLGVPEFLWQ
jgi:hypothetical protein